MRLPPLTLVIGGASSGKSVFAERLVVRTGLAKVYVATAQAFDAEMEQKIAEHRARRLGQGWRTIEAPLDLELALAQVERGEIVLVDCVSFWLTNQMLDEGDVDVSEECDVLCDALDAMSHPVVLVTNDVSGGVVPDNALARAFRSAQGRLNQRLAAQAGLVVQVTAGLPQVLKGSPDVIEAGVDLGDDPYEEDGDGAPGQKAAGRGGLW